MPQNIVGRSEYEVDNVFDRAFRDSNAKVEREIEEITKCNSKPVDMADAEIFDFSQFANGDIRPAAFHLSLSCFFDISPFNNASPINSFFATTPSLPLSNSGNDFKDPSQIDTLRFSTGKQTGTTGSQNISGGYEQYGQRDLLEISGQLFLEPGETECSPSPFTADQ